MAKDETQLAMVHRRILQGERNIIRQRGILNELRINKRSTKMAEILLWNFEDVQRHYKDI